MISIQNLDTGAEVCLTKIKKFYINFIPSYESYNNKWFYYLMTDNIMDDN